MRVTILFLYFWLIKRNSSFFTFTQFSVLRRSKCNSFSSDLLKTYAILLHEIGNFLDDFIPVNEINAVSIHRDRQLS